MKKKIIIAAATMFLLALLFPISTFAGTHDVGDWDALKNVFETDPDEEVVINLTGNLEFGDYLTAKAGQQYTINGNDIYKLESAQFGGEGTVIINADIEVPSGGAGNGLTTRESVDVTVNGDISAQYNGVAAYNNSKVTIDGKITGFNVGILADNNSKVTAFGQVFGSYGIDAYESAVVTVTGDVLGTNTGIYVHAISNTVITITGDVLGNCYGIYTNYGAGNAVITVNGNVEGGTDTDNGEAAVYARGKSDITVNGNACGLDGDPDGVVMSDPEDYSDGGDAVSAGEQAIVHITGNAVGGTAYGTWAYSGYGVCAWDNASVTVDGDVIAGDVVADLNTKHLENQESYAGDGIYGDNTATVKVGGDVKGGNTSAEGGVGGRGIYFYADNDGEIGSITVNGNVSGGTGGTDGEDGSAIRLGYPDLESPEEYLPTITVYSLTPGGEASLIDGNYDYPDMEDLIEALRADINFFIRTAPAENGTVTADKETAKKDEIVTFTLTPCEGYKAESAKVGETALTITARAGVYTYVVPENGFVTGVGTFVIDENYVPNTGDSTNLVLYIVLGFAALMAMTAVVFLRKKEN